VNSATAGLHLALEALGVGPGDRVLTTPYTFTATAEVARYLGADPLFVDIEKDSFNIDPGLVEEALERERNKPKSGGRIAAVIPVHVGGHVAAMGRILAAARARGVPVVEDARHAFPSRTANGFAGAMGDIGVYSFYATKTMTTGEGGMVVLRDPELARRIGIMRLHGIDREIWNRYTAKKASCNTRSSKPATNTTSPISRPRSGGSSSPAPRNF
jgi:dTDP-4-amino-4,6-dideoxygalactose transaminase